MVVGVLRLEFRLHACNSLKEKRGLVKPLLARLRRKFGVAAAEVESQDQLGSAILGVSAVSSDGAHARSILQSVVKLIDSEPGPYELVDAQIELVHDL